MKSFLSLILISLIISKPIKEDLGIRIYFVGVNDDNLPQLDGQYPLEHGMAYNSYMVIDGDEVSIFDTTEINFKDEWFNKVEKRLNGLYPKYLIIQHMELDHSAYIVEFTKKYPKTITMNINLIEI